MKSDRFLLYTLLFMFALLLGGTVPLFILGFTGWAVTVVIGFIISFVYITFAYITIRQAFGKAAKIFYKYLFGGMAFRFIFFLLILFLVHSFTSLPILGFVLSFVIFYIIFQIFEARLILKELDRHKNR